VHRRDRIFLLIQVMYVLSPMCFVAPQAIGKTPSSPFCSHGLLGRVRSFSYLSLFLLLFPPSCVLPECLVLFRKFSFGFGVKPLQQLQHAFVSPLHAGMDSLIFQQRSLFWFPLFELLFLDSIVSVEHNTSSAAMAYLVNKKKLCFFFLAFVSFFIFLVSLEVVHFSEAATIIIDLKHDTKRRGGRGACFCRMAYNASSMLCRIADNASSMLLLWLLLHGEQVDHSFLSPLRRVWK
jgi:hypothetical protein